MTDPRDVWITGAGLVTSLGEGLDAHAAAIAEGRTPVLNTESFAPYTIHPAPPLDLDKQIAKKLDQRQMEAWQRLGTYTAGLALESAGLKGRAELLAETQMIVAAGGGERDTAVDSAIMAGLRTAEDRGRYINERLMSDLRPTLFLAQLSNLMAGNIAIVHGVVGASRTFMGEEAAGIDALRVGRARIAARQGDTFLVGGAASAERWDLPVIFEAGGYLRKAPFAPVFARRDEPGFYSGSVGAFMVLEAAERAQARGVAPLARLAHVATDRCRRSPGEAAASLTRLWSGIADKLKPGRFAILSGATGVAGATEEEAEALAQLAPGVTVHAVGDWIGHGIEAQFPAGVLLAAMMLREHAGIDQVVVTGIGHWRGEGLALVERIG